ncbi:MAG: T9SS type A sorting domain-containing protein [Bacteroidales bacterium]|nr:T9SS type A sorting domain-containing protein [Bacteroidales bacterium]
MKNKFFLAIVALVFSSVIAFGQNAHSTYSSASGDIITSAVLTNPNNATRYIVGIDEYFKLFVTQLDFSVPFPQPDNTNSRAFQMSDSTYGKIFLNGGFFDEDENIVVYGYMAADNRGIVIKINMNNGTPISFTRILGNTANTAVVDGCYSAYFIGATNIKCYSFIANGGFFRVRNTLAPAGNKKFSNMQMTSVSWDNVARVNVVSGNSDTLNIIGCLAGTLSLNPGTFTYIHSYDFTASEWTNKNVLSGNGYYCDSIAYLCQDIREPITDGDGVWITAINYLSGQVISSNVYKFDFEKAFILDVAHNFTNIYILGHHNYMDSQKKYLLQVDLYDPTLFIGKYMNDLDVDTVGGGTWPYVKTAYLNKIYFDDYSFNVHSSSAALGNGYLVETFDLNYDNCDPEINVSLMDFTYDTDDFSYANGSGVNFAPASTLVSTYVNYTLSNDTLCDAFGGKSANYEYNRKRIQQMIENKQAINNETSLQSIQSVSYGEVDVTADNRFICRNFNGQCKYKIFDMFGKLVDEGTTQNGIYNSIDVKTNGVYIIQVCDSDKQTINQKIIITR